MGGSFKHPNVNVYCLFTFISCFDIDTFICGDIMLNIKHFKRGVILDNGSLRPIHVELRSLSHRIHRFNSPNKRAVESVTGTNSWIIGYLADHEGMDVFQKDIEKEFDITRSTASKVIDLMEQKGLVERQTVPHDARLRKLVLTEKSRQLVNLICIDKENLEKTLTKGFSDEEKATLTEYILRMRNNLEEEGGK